MAVQARRLALAARNDTVATQRPARRGDNRVLLFASAVVAVQHDPVPGLLPRLERTRDVSGWYCLAVWIFRGNGNDRDSPNPLPD